MEIFPNSAFKSSNLNLGHILHSSKLINPINLDNYTLFHTEYSHNPYVVFDLGNTRFVRKITITNRMYPEDFKIRASTLRLCISKNGFDWVNCNFRFDENLDFGSSEIFENLKYIRLYLTEPSYFHLKDITIDYVEGVLIDGSQNEVLQLQYGFISNNTFYPTHSAGYFSILTTIFYHLSSIYPGVKKINGLYSFSKFKDRGDYDPWGDYFLDPDPSKIEFANTEFNLSLLHHSDYKKLDFSNADILIKKYFQPSKSVVEKEAFFIQKYSIEPSKTIAVCMRGTDKHTEVEPTPIDEYVSTVEKILIQDPTCRVLIQTDQKQFRDFFLDILGKDKIFFVDELPVTESDVVIHNLIKDDHLDFSINLLSMVQIMSKCKYLITHTGNVAYWTVLFRGNSLNVTQL